MNILVLISIIIISMSPFVCLAGEFDNPLENQNFIYSEENIQKSIGKAAKTKDQRIRHTFENATGDKHGKNQKLKKTNMFQF